MMGMNYTIKIYTSKAHEIEKAIEKYLMLQ